MRRSGFVVPVEHLRERRRVDRARPEALELPGRPGQDDDDAAAGVENDAGRGARDAERARLPAAASPACARPAAKSAYGRRIRSANRREICSISASSAASTSSSRPATRATSSIVLSSCVGPSPPETRQTSASKPSSQGSFEIGGVVADDRDPDRLEPEPERLLGIERPVEVGSLAAHELAARDDDRGARALQREDGIVRCPFFGTATRAPATRTTTLRGEANESVSLLRGEPLRLAALERAAVERRPRAGALPHLHERGALRGRHRDTLRDGGRRGGGRAR